MQRRVIGRHAQPLRLARVQLLKRGHHQPQDRFRIGRELAMQHAPRDGDRQLHRVLAPLPREISDAVPASSWINALNPEITGSTRCAARLRRGRPAPAVNPC